MLRSTLPRKHSKQRSSEDHREILTVVMLHRKVSCGVTSHNPSWPPTCCCSQTKYCRNYFLPSCENHIKTRSSSPKCNLT